MNNSLPIIDPVHGLFLGNTTAFDAITTAGTQQQDNRPHISPSQQQSVPLVSTISPSTRITERYAGPIGNDADPAILHIKGM